jgi:hypothetical protein
MDSRAGRCNIDGGAAKGPCGNGRGAREAIKMHVACCIYINPLHNKYMYALGRGLREAGPCFFGGALRCLAPGVISEKNTCGLNEASMPYAQTTQRSSTKLRRCTDIYVKTTASGMTSVGQASVGTGPCVREAAEGTILLGGHMRFFERSQRADRAPVVCTYPRDRSHRQRSCAPCVATWPSWGTEGHLEYLGLHPPQKSGPQHSPPTPIWATEVGCPAPPLFGRLQGCFEFFFGF